MSNAELSPLKADLNINAALAQPVIDVIPHFGCGLWEPNWSFDLYHGGHAGTGLSDHSTDSMRSGFST